MPDVIMAEHIFRCRKCREKLFDGYYIATEHKVQLFSTEEIGDTEGKTCSITVGTLWYISSNWIPDWIEGIINEYHWTKGKINCPKCNGRLGSFDFLSIGKCPCGKSVLPPIHILRSRVDHHLVMKIQRCDEKTNRLHQSMDNDECRMKSSINSTDNINVKVTDGKQDDILLSSTDQLADKELEGIHHVSSSFTTAVSTSERSNQYPDISMEEFSSIPTGRYNRLENHKMNNSPQIVTRQLLNNRLDHLSNVTVFNKYSYLAGDEEDTMVEQNVGNHGNKSYDRKSLSSVKTSNNFSKLRKELDPENTQNIEDIVYPDEHTCAICYELYCNPMKCKPCNHVFCESCLRLLGKRMSAIRILCPLCRSNIRKCEKDKDLIETLHDLYTDQYKRRLKQQKQYLHKEFYPLPHEDGGGHRYGGGRGRRGRPPAANFRQPNHRNYMSFYVCLWFLLIFIAFCLYRIKTVFTCILAPFVWVYNFLTHLTNFRHSNYVVLGVLVAVIGVAVITFNNKLYFGY